MNYIAHWATQRRVKLSRSEYTISYSLPPFVFFQSTCACPNLAHSRRLLARARRSTTKRRASHIYPVQSPPRSRGRFAGRRTLRSLSLARGLHVTRETVKPPETKSSDVSALVLAVLFCGRLPAGGSDGDDLHRSAEIF